MSDKELDFNKIWGANSDINYDFTDDNYLTGWDFIGNVPPARGMFNRLQHDTDRKQKYLNDQLKALSIKQYTVNDATMPTGNTGLPDTLFSGIGNRIKNITGENDWKAAPSTTLSELKKNLAALATLVDPIKQNGWNGNVVGNVNGNAATATKLQTPCTISLTGNASGSANFDGSGNISINTTVNNSAAVGNHAESDFLRYRGATTTNGENTLWDQIGIKEYNNVLPESLNGTYTYGAVISFPSANNRLDVWCDCYASNTGTGLYYRTGWKNEKRAWARLLDSNNYNSYAPTKTGSGASGTWPISISGNADTVDGYHASDLFRHLGGNQTPVITDIFDRAGTIDMSTMSAADKATHKANINKASNASQNIWNTDTGIYAYGGDYDIAGYNRGTLKLTQSYKNFDKILVVGANDRGELLIYKLWDVWALANAFAGGSRFQLFHGGDYWFLYGSTRKGTWAHYALSTDTVWSCQDQNCGIVAIYGIKY